MNFKEYLLSILGPYVPFSQSVSTSDGGTLDQIVSGFSGVDWPWIFAALFFLLVVYSFFRIIGKLIGG